MFKVGAFVLCHSSDWMSWKTSAGGWQNCRSWRWETTSCHVVPPCSTDKSPFLNTRNSRSSTWSVLTGETDPDGVKPPGYRCCFSPSDLFSDQNEDPVLLLTQILVRQVRPHSAARMKHRRISMQTSDLFSSQQQHSMKLPVLLLE